MSSLKLLLKIQKQHQLVRPQSKYIKTKSEFSVFIKSIKRAQIIAVDTEFTRRTTFYPILSLIQVADDKGNIYLIDCLAGFDFKPFSGILKNKKIIKIIHSATQDLEIFYRQFKLDHKSIKNVFDTQIMANIAGVGFNIGYGGLVAKTLNKEVNKTQQNSNWQRRPLSQKQIEYAFIDVLHLHEIYAILSEKLKELNRYSWFEEEMQSFLKNISNCDENDLFKQFSFSRKSPEYVYLLKKLIIWRDKNAKKFDVPRRHLISNEDLESVALRRKYGFLRLNNKLKKQIAKILDFDERKIDFSTEENKNFMSLKAQAVLQKIKNLIAQVAEENNISPQLLTTTKELKSLVLKHQKLSDVFSGWRADLLVEKIKVLLEKDC